MTQELAPAEASIVQPRLGRSLLLSDALLVAAATAAGYHFAYLFEVGYCGYFGIPSSLIRVEVIDVIATTVGSLLGLSYLTSTMGPILGVRFRRWLTMTLDRQWGFIWLSAGAVLWAPSTVIWNLAGNLIAVVVIAVKDMYQQKIGPIKLWRLRREADRDVEPHPETAIGRIYEVYGRRVTRLLSLFLLASVVIFFAGQLRARFQSSFVVVPGNPPKVILRVYGDDAVAATAYLERRATTMRFSVIPIGSLENVEHRYLKHLSPQAFPLVLPPHIRSRKSELKSE